MLLQVENLNAHYGKSHVLHGVTLHVEEAGIVALLGRNGSGRSTTLKTIMGLVPPTRGNIKLKGEDLTGHEAHLVARRGVGYVPEERLVFPNLTVEENLLMGVKASVGGAPEWSFADVFQYFPRLKERRNQIAGYMSGGEQQMLSICRTVLGNPLVLLVDEPTEGLAPQVVDIVSDVLLDIQRRGVGVLLVEQKMSMAMKVADRALIMGHGQVVFDGTPEALRDRGDIRRQWLEAA